MGDTNGLKPGYLFPQFTLYQNFGSPLGTCIQKFIVSAKQAAFSYSYKNQSFSDYFQFVPLDVYS